jgi:hypothetical protein
MYMQAGGGVRVLKGLVIQWAHPRLEAPNHAILHRTNVRRPSLSKPFLLADLVLLCAKLADIDRYRRF